MTSEEIQAAIERHLASGGAIQQLSDTDRKQRRQSPVAAADDPALVAQLQASAALGVAAIARKLRRSNTTIYRMTARNGITLPTSRSSLKAERDRLAPQVRRMAGRNSPQRIATALGVSRCLVRRIAKEHGINISR